MIKKILVTGSNGTIGTRLCEKLLSCGYEVCGADIKPNKWNREIDNLTTIVDLRRKEDIAKLPKDIDLVIHLAANARVYDLVLDPSLARDNIDMIFNVLEYCRINKIKKFIFSSSREVYGNSDKIIYKEDDASFDRSESPYSASKIAGEALVRSYHRCFDIDFIILRFSNVYGMYDDSNRVIPLFIKLTKEKKDLEVYGADKLLDFTYIDDTVNGVISCIEKFDQTKNDVYNIASNTGIKIIDVAKIIQNVMGSDNMIFVKENRTGEVVKFVADISKANKKLGYRPTVNIKDGIQASVRWYLNFYSSEQT
ncbi:NAD dependent epimerase/dehydratase family [Methanocella conradii HZ254]|uniref:NAD dependent epimerase/dehydratase family n=1 Tax=Methanocella conradii (strain DSM 24694 / JCM 17849 / CGMCC 1.5162 / HZ254) TaxID=1041930 RepID=H8I6R0_METCZ|nr:NAD-dependent epimerase/dehydratase family protein [Methanocella conradii]AFC99380.1 NAD dependent epimerase/dehydratase family [Methanocella conradii HZ254]